ncbi:MAG: hypothetical protein HON70_30055, partial [Lentisphaerae bacterium]|nr:hypothetical protein [Lentisphaerota bacterium]
YYEYLLGWNPRATNLQAELDATADADALSNIDEQTYGTDPNVADTDDDGVIDGTEVTSGTDPADSRSPLALRVMEFGSGDTLTVAESAAQAKLDLGTYTVEAWVKPAALADNSYVVNKASGSDIAYRLGYDSAGRVSLTVGTQTVTSLPDAAIAADSWSHIAASVGNGQITVTVFTDVSGTYQTYTATETLVSAVPQDGGDLDIGSAAFSGQMDEVRVWNSVRTAADLAANRTSTLVGAEGNLVAYYSFDDSGVTVEDFTQALALPSDWTLAGVRGNTDGSDPAFVTDDGALTDTDTDLDGMTDAWELANDLDPTDPNDATADSDGDGLNNLYEYLTSRDPNTAEVDTTNSDTDALTDLEEQALGTRPDKADTDDDGVTDSDELIQINANTWKITNALYSMAHYEDVGGTITFTPGRSLDLAELPGNTGIAVPESFRFERNGAAWTLEAWIRPPAAALDGVILSYQVDGKAAMELGLTAGVPYAKFDSVTGTDVIAGGAGVGIPAFTANNWRHVAAIWEPTTSSLSLIIDGMLEFAQLTNLTPVTGPGQLYIGGTGDAGGTGRLASGLLDEVRVWDVARTQADIQAQRDTIVETGAANLLAYYRFDDSGENVEDFAQAYPGATAEDVDLEAAANGVAVTAGVADWVTTDNVAAIAGIDDADGDNMPDWWEALYGGALVAADDLDADGLSNLYEFYCRTNPNKSDTDNDSLVDGEEDMDADGLSNAAESTAQTDPLATDTDDDGVSDYQETQDDTSPIDSLDVAEIRTYAAQFSGTNYLEIADKVRYALDSWTVEAWVKLDAGAGAGTIVRREVADLGGGDYAINYELGIEDDGGTLRPYVRYVLPDGTDADALPDEIKAGGAGTTVTLPQSAGDYVWTHLAGVHDGTTGELALFVDGVARAEPTAVTTTLSAPSAGTGPSRLLIGQDVDGMLDDVRVWNQALTGGQIATSRGSTLARGLTETAMYLPFDDRGEHAENFSVLADWWSDWSDAALMNDSAGDPVTWVEVSFPPDSLDTDEDGVTDVTEDTANLDPQDSLSSYKPAFLTFDGQGLVTVQGQIPGAPGSETRYSMSEYTIETWVRLAELPSAQGPPAEVILATYVVDGNANYTLGIDVDDKPFIRFDPDPNVQAGSAVIAKSTVALQANEWVHLAGMFGTELLTLVVDGERAAQLATGFIPATGEGALTIGQNLKGDLVEMRFWSSARDISMIANDMRSFVMFLPPGGVGVLNGTMTQTADPRSTFQQLSSGGTVEAWVHVPALSGATGAVVGRPVAMRANPGRTARVMSGINGAQASATGTQLWNHYVGVNAQGRILAGHSVEAYWYSGGTGTSARDEYRYHTPTVLSSTPIDDGEWHHIAFTFDGDAGLALYIDGVLDVSSAAQTLLTRESYVDAGGTPISNQSGGMLPPLNRTAITVWGPLAGDTVVGLGATPSDLYVDDIRIWNSARTQTEIVAARSSALTGSEIGLIDYFTFDFAQGTAGDVVTNYADVRNPSDRAPDVGRITSGNFAYGVNAPVEINAVLGLASDRVGGGSVVGYFPFTDWGTTAEDFMYRNDVAYAGTFDPAHVTFTSALDTATVGWDSPLIDDSDFDGMPDWWETRYGLNPTDPSGDSAFDGDPDDDGLTNLVEFRIDKLSGVADTNVTRPPHSRPDVYDSDGDGIADGDEDADSDTISNSDETDLRTWAWSDDTDDDGEKDNEELQAGTSPVESLDPFIGRALEVDGAATDYAVVYGDSDRTGSAGYEFGTQFTLEAWVRPDSADADGGIIIEKTRSEDGLVNYRFGVNANRQLYLEYQSPSGLSQTVKLETTFLPADEWSYVAVTSNGAYTVDTTNDGTPDSDWRVDITFVASVTLDGVSYVDFTSSDQGSIVAATGQGNLTFGAGLDGQLDEVRIWDTVRLPADLLSDQNRFAAIANPVATPNLVGYWRFDDGGTYAEDFTQHLPAPADIDPDWVTAARMVNGARMIEGLSGLEDSDSDSLPDSWEYDNFGDLSHDGTADTDGDGLTDWSEYEAGTDPNDTDTDDDGIVDADEDADFDGLTNLEEQTYGTLPGVPDTDDDGVGDGYEVTGDLNADGVVQAGHITSPRHSMSHVFAGPAGVVPAPHRSLNLAQVAAPAGIVVPLGARFDRAGGAWTLESWIRPDNTTDADGGLILCYKVGDKVAMEIGMTADNKPYVRFETAGGLEYVAGGAPLAALPNDEWHHVAGVYDPAKDTLTLFVDGVITTASVTVGYAVPVVGSGELFLAGTGDAGGAGRLSAGLLDEVRVWSVARTRDEVEQARDEVVEVGTVGLLAYYRFDDAGLNIEDFAVAYPDVTARDYDLEASASAVLDGIADATVAAAGVGPATWASIGVYDAAADGGAWNGVTDAIVLDTGTTADEFDADDTLIAGTAPALATALALPNTVAAWNGDFAHVDAAAGGDFAAAADVLFFETYDSDTTDGNITYDASYDVPLAGAADGTSDWVVVADAKPMRGFDDADDDQLPDWWESLTFTDLAGTADDDNDGLTNQYEYWCRTNPFEIDTDNDGLTDADEDFDGDGFVNLREQAEGSDPRLADTDDDNIDDGTEILNGTLPTSALSPLTYRAMTFTDGAALVRLPLESRFELTDSWALEAWIRPDTGVTGDIIRRTVQAGRHNYRLYIDTDGNPAVEFYKGSGSTPVKAKSTDGIVADSEGWSHLAASMNLTDRTLRLFVNGVEVASAETSSPPAATGIGLVETVLGGNAYTGAIKDVRFWSAQRTEAQIAADMGRALSGVEAGLTAYYRFDDGQAAVNPGGAEDAVQSSDSDWLNNWAHAARLEGGVNFEDLDGSSSAKTSPVLDTRTDVDNDGIADYWELDFFGTVAVADETTDSDGDGLSDLYEFLTSLVFGLADVPNPNVASENDTDGDADGDGLTNLEEQFAGTRPDRRDTDDDGIFDNIEIVQINQQTRYTTNPLFSMAHYETVNAARTFTPARALDLAEVASARGIPVPQSDRFNRSGGAWTLEAWIKPDLDTDGGGADTGDDTGAILSYQVGGKTAMEIGLNAGIPYALFQTVGNTTVTAGGAEAGIPAFQDGKWRHVAAVWSPGTSSLSLTIDGMIEFSQYTAFAPLAGHGQLYLAGVGAADGTGRLAAGLLDEVRVWDSPRNRVQLQAGR